MKKFALFASLLTLSLLLQLQSAWAQQTAAFSMTAQEIQGLTSDEFAKPNIPDNAVTVDPNNPGAPRPLYLVYRYYSCGPWFRSHCQSFYSSAPGFDSLLVDVDTANDDPSLQIVNEANEARLGLSPGTAYLHPAYGLYCLKVRIPVYWNEWLFGDYHQFYVRFTYNAPYICWWEHWWYYWRAPGYFFQVTLDGSQEVPPISSQGTASGVLSLDPLYQTLGYDIHYGNLGSGFTVAHIHGPALPGQIANPIFTLQGGVQGSTTGRLFGTTAALTPTQLNNLRGGSNYANIHTTVFPNGEIRGQISTVNIPVYCPWRPCWSPLLRWGRVANIWCLTVTHPYGYAWDPWYRQRAFCLYGLRYYYPPIGPYLVPGGAVPPGLRPPGIRQLSYYYLTYPWQYYQYIPYYHYWPYSTYCGRWYWWYTSFLQYRWCPPVVQFATWVNPTDPTDPLGTSVFPTDPQTNHVGTVGIHSTRALFKAPGDQIGNGLVNLQSLKAYRDSQNETQSSFFDIFSIDEIPP